MFSWVLQSLPILAFVACVLLWYNRQRVLAATLVWLFGPEIADIDPGELVDAFASLPEIMRTAGIWGLVSAVTEGRLN